MNANYTVENELEQPLKKWQPDLSREDRQARIRGLLEYVGMTPAESYATRYPHQLSGGEKQRVALIRSLLMNPDLISSSATISRMRGISRKKRMVVLGSCTSAKSSKSDRSKK
jgi:peptide/nickel transport system ATP-binding protein